MNISIFKSHGKCFAFIWSACVRVCRFQFTNQPTATFQVHKITPTLKPTPATQNNHVFARKVLICFDNLSSVQKYTNELKTFLVCSFSWNAEKKMEQKRENVGIYIGEKWVKYIWIYAYIPTEHTHTKFGSEIKNPDVLKME